MMERELWKKVYRLVRSLGRSRRRSQVQFSDAVIVLVHLWGVLHDRPCSWACDRRNWTGCRPRRLPSGATMSRRLRSDSVREFLAAAEERLRQRIALVALPDAAFSSEDAAFSSESSVSSKSSFAPEGLAKVVDGKPLPVGGYSHDPDAATGYGAGRLSKGYKL